MKCLSKKLDWKHFDLYMIIEYIKLQIYYLNLSIFMKIYFIFHISLLESYKSSIILEWTRDSSSSIVINDENEWKIEEILNSKLCYCQLWYKIHWTSYFISKNFWQLVSDLINVSDFVKQFHIHYLFKSSKIIQ